MNYNDPDVSAETVPRDAGALLQHSALVKTPRADAIVDTIGMASIVDTAINLLGQGGKLGLGGMHDIQARASFSILKLLQKGAAIVGTVEGDSEPQTFVPYLVDLFVEGRFPIDKLLTFFDFEEINTAIAAQANGSVIKPILKI